MRTVKNRLGYLQRWDPWVSPAIEVAFGISSWWSKITGRDPGPGWVLMLHLHLHFFLSHIFWDSDSILCQGGLHLSLVYFAMSFLTVSSMRTGHLSFLLLCPVWRFTGQASGSKMQWFLVGMEGPIQVRSSQKPSEQWAEARHGLAESCPMCPSTLRAPSSTLQPITRDRSSQRVRSEKKKETACNPC